MAYEYDPAGRRTSLTDHTGFAVRYEYDSAGRLAALRDAADALVVQYTYDAVGRLSSESKANGAKTDYTHDANGRLVEITHRDGNGNVNSQYRYIYDATGQRTSMETLDGIWEYSYDLTGQLTSAVFSSSNPEIPDQDLRYEYDSLGNRVRTIQNGAVADYTANELNQYATAGEFTYRYDPDGNLVEELGPEGSRRFTYNALNQLVRVVTADGVWEYEYDALGNRTATIANGQRTEYLVDPTGLANVVAEYDGSGVRSSSFVHGLGLEGTVRSGDWYYYDFDATGSTVGISDNGGEYSNSYAYDPFGNALVQTEIIENSFKFVGEFGVMSEENGLHFMRARYYDSAAGRFIVC